MLCIHLYIFLTRFCGMVPALMGCPLLIYGLRAMGLLRKEPPGDTESFPAACGATAAVFHRVKTADIALPGLPLRADKKERQGATYVHMNMQRCSVLLGRR